MTVAQLSNRRRAHLSGLALAALVFAIATALGGTTAALRPWTRGGKSLPADWLELPDTLDEAGVDIRASWKGTFYGLMSGGLDAPRGAFDGELTLGLALDFGKLAGIAGLTAEGAVRYRDGRDPNTYVGASGTFSPSRYQSGQQWRLMPFFVTYTTPELFGVKDFLTISGGWQNAYAFFADQPETKLFTNNALGTTKGIGGANAFPWSSSYAAWGGYLEVKPATWHYVMTGLYMAIPEATNRGNHGLDFSGYGPDPQRNGLYFLAEAGITPRIGPGELPGKYAFGAVYWGLENRALDGRAVDGKSTFYWMAGQTIFRQSDATTATQGLRAFAFVNYAPVDGNAMPFYAQCGFVFEGLLPRREADKLGFAAGYGNYSDDRILAGEEAGRNVQKTNEAVLEADYRVQITKAAFIQPYWQCIVRPGGTGMIGNASILGLHMGVTF